MQLKRLIANFKERYLNMSFMRRNKTMFENFSYLTVLQVFLLLMPLITYPYLTRVFGNELYGLIITAQVVASYASVFVNFSFNEVGAKFVSIYRDDSSMLSQLISTIFSVRLVIWFISLGLYSFVIFLVPTYHNFYLLFFLSFGVTFNELLSPQFFFQGIEKMRYITFINITTRLFFVLLIFVLIHDSEDYLLYPVLTLCGHLLGGVISMYIVFVKEGVKFVRPKRSTLKMLLHDSLPLFYTDLICTIKDKFNYLLIGGCVGYGQVPVYDLGSKITNIMLKPVSIISTVVFPRISKTKNISLFRKSLFIVISVIVAVSLLTLIFLKPIVAFLNPNITDLFPIRLYLLSPLFLAASSFIAHNFFIGFGYSKYVLYSILVTTSGYLIGLGVIFLTGNQTYIISFIILTVFSYLLELIYRIIVARKIVKQQ